MEKVCDTGDCSKYRPILCKSCPTPEQVCGRDECDAYYKEICNKCKLPRERCGINTCKQIGGGAFCRKLTGLECFKKHSSVCNTLKGEVATTSIPLLMSQLRRGGNSNPETTYFMKTYNQNNRRYFYHYNITRPGTHIDQPTGKNIRTWKGASTPISHVCIPFGMGFNKEEWRITSSVGGFNGYHNLHFNCWSRYFSGVNVPSLEVATQVATHLYPNSPGFDIARVNGGYRVWFATQHAKMIAKWAIQHESPTMSYVSGPNNAYKTYYFLRYITVREYDVEQYVDKIIKPTRQATNGRRWSWERWTIPLVEFALGGIDSKILMRNPFVYHYTGRVVNINHTHYIAHFLTKNGYYAYLHSPSGRAIIRPNFQNYTTVSTTLDFDSWSSGEIGNVKKMLSVD